MERKNYLVPVLVLLIFLLVGAILYLLVKDNNVDDNNDKENNETVKWEVKTERLYTGTGYYKFAEDIDNGTIKYQTEEENVAILFKPDKTFVMAGGTYAFLGYEGTYILNGDLLTLIANKEYGSSSRCYNINEVIETYIIYEVNGNQKLYSITNNERPEKLGMNLVETTKEAEKEKEKMNYTTGFLNFLLNPTRNYEPCVDR